MLSGPVTRTRKSEKKYAKHKIMSDKTVCEFCLFSRDHEQFIEETSYFWVVKNIFGYDLWEGCEVLEHLMLVPKRHVHALSEFNKPELSEYMKYISRYEDSGYSLYTRTPNSITKSVPHHHTHFIKLDNKRKNSIFYLRKPHVMIYK